MISGSDLYVKLTETVSYSLQNYRSLEIKEPIYVMLSFYGVEGMNIREINSTRSSHDVVPYETDKMIFPEIFIEDIDDVNVPETIRPIMDALWNAYGYSKYPLELE